MKTEETQSLGLEELAVISGGTYPDFGGMADLIEKIVKTRSGENGGGQ